MTILKKLATCTGLMLAFVLMTSGQVPLPTTQPQKDEILRINTDLIQTGVSVTNRKGEFVTGLKLEDFQLFVDGKPVTPQFFDTVKVGPGIAPASASDRRAGSRSTTQITDVSRTMVFVIDDLHMSADSLIRTRRVVQRWVENEILPSDRVAIVATSGKVGFLQQFTNDKEVLLTACDRLSYSQKTGDEAGPPPMSEFSAQSIDRGDRDVIAAFIQLTLRYNPGLRPEQAMSIIKARARGVLNNAHAFTQTTLGAVESSAAQAAKFPGRKAIYYFSDGMLLDPGNTDTPDTLRKITSAAARANVVIYSFDAKGLDASLPGSNGVESPQMTSLALSLDAAEKFERQDALAYFADKTGGRFIHNTNDIKGNLSAVTEEAFQYYLLAWEPAEESSKKLHKIEVKIPGRTDLKVSYQTGYLDRSTTRATANPTPGPASAAAVAPAPYNMADAAEGVPTALPTHLTLNYLQIGDEGPSLSATIAVDPTSVRFEPVAANPTADLEFTVVLYNQDGKVETAFKSPLRVNSNTLDVSHGHQITYEYRTVLKPGLYQMRVRSTDQRTQRTGTAAAWLRIPDAAKGITVSSLLLGEIRPGEKPDAPVLQRNVDYRFTDRNTLKYLGFIYAPPAKTLNKQQFTIKAELTQASKIVESNTGSITPMQGDTDTRLTFAGELSLASVPAGRYELRVTISRGKDKPLVRRSYIEVL